MLSAIPVWSADNSAKKAGVLEFNVTPDPIVILPDPELVCIFDTFYVPFAIILFYVIILYAPKFALFSVPEILCVPSPW